MTSVQNESSLPIIINADNLHPLSKQPTTEFLYPEEYEGHMDGVLITFEDINKRTFELAKHISEVYRGKRPCLLCVLKGSCMFFNGLLLALQKFKQIYTIQFIRVQSYEGVSSKGDINVSGIDLQTLQHQPIIIVEDIIDTGVTLSKLIPMIRNEAKPESVEICSLLVKRLETEMSRSKKDRLQARFVGFSIPNVFVIGYGLDCNEWYRDLRDVWVISEMGKAFAL